MKNIYFILAVACIFATHKLSAAELNVEFSSLDLEGTDLVSLSPINLNEDLQLTFEQGGASTPPKRNASNGRITLTMNAVMRINGLSDDVLITQISLVSPKASNTFSTNGADCTPSGTFTIDKTTFTSTWSNEAGANSVQIINTMGAPVLSAIKVTYSGGKGGNGGGGNETPDDPVITPEIDNLINADFSKAEDFSSMTILNIDESTYKWQYDRNAGNVYIRNEFGSTSSLPKDDYLVTPALNLKSGLTYRLSFSAWNGSAPYPEKIGAYLGTAPAADALTTVVIPETQLEGTAKTLFSKTFTVDSDGDYYVAIHASSDPGMFILYADDFFISRGVLPAAPAEITDFKATPDPTGRQTVSLSLTAPELNMAGEPLQGLKSITFYRDGTEIGVKECAPGETVTFEDTVDAENSYRYIAVADSEAGKGFDAIQDVWVGLSTPMAPEELSVSETAPGKLKFTWKPVTTNIHGHSIAPESVTYTIYAGSTANIIADNLSGSEADVDYPAEGAPQVITDFIIKAKTEAGFSATGATTPIVAVGTPHSVPFFESFPDALPTDGQQAQIIADPNHASGTWGYFKALILDDIIPVKPDEGMLAFGPYAVGDVSVWRSGKIAIPADIVNPYLSFFYYTIPGAQDKVVVDFNGTSLKEFTIEGDKREWKEMLIPVSEYKGQTIRIGLTATCVDVNNKICIDEIAIKEEPVKDIAITRARIPQEMIQGMDHLCSIRITNHGVSDSEPYTVSVKEDDNEICQFTGSDLKRGEIKEFTFTVKHDSFNRQSASYTVSVTSSNDDNTENNIKTTDVSFKQHELPSPSDINIKRMGDNYEITWEAPDFANMAARQITEGFEAYDEFLCDKAGEWSFHDGDGNPVLGIRDGYHGYPNMFSPMAFMVFNNHDGFFPQIGTSVFDAYEGGQCMMSAAVDVINSIDVNNDDRLISPQLSGNAQTISFYARSSGMVFPEDIFVMASSTDKRASSFTTLKEFKSIGNTWTRYEVELPAGTRYFAICNVSHDQYMLFLDNISFEAAPLSANITGYNIYTGEADSDNWVKLNSEPVKSPTFVTTDLDESKYLKVSAIMDNGCVTYSAPIPVKTSGVDMIYTDSDCDKTEYFDVNGTRINGYPSASGIYIVRNGSKVRKIVI